MSSVSLVGNHFAGETLSNKTLVAYEGRNSHGHHLWSWLCLACSEIRGPSTIAHMVRSTMCQKCRLEFKNNPRWQGHEDIPGVMLNSLKTGAVARNLSWEISDAYLWSIWTAQAGLCAYTGWSLSFGYKSKSTASLDRIDSYVGYIEGNVQWVHKDINRMKNNFTESRFLELCSAVKERND